MKRIGIIGGLGPEATIDYYRIITESYLKKQEGQNYPDVIIYSMNLKELFRMAESKEWPQVVDWLLEGITSLHRAGADFALISANTPHIVFDEVRTLSPVPMLSIVEETLTVVEEQGLKKVGLMGTKFTMQSDFYQKTFSTKGIEIVVPNGDEQQYIHTKLEEEIGLGQIIEKTRKDLLKIVKRMIGNAAIEGLILGCTELPLILTKEEFGIPFLNTTKIHAESAVRYSLSED